MNLRLWQAIDRPSPQACHVIPRIPRCSTAPAQTLTPVPIRRPHSAVPAAWLDIICLECAPWRPDHWGCQFCPCHADHITTCALRERAERERECSEISVFPVLQLNPFALTDLNLRSIDRSLQCNACESCCLPERAGCETVRVIRLAGVYGNVPLP